MSSEAKGGTSTKVECIPLKGALTQHLITAADAHSLRSYLSVMTSETEPTQSQPTAATTGANRVRHAVTRPAGLLLITGLAAGGGFAAVSGISSAAPTSTPSSTTATAAPTTGSTATPTAPGPRGRGGMGLGGFGAGHGFGGHGFGGHGFGGHEGTVTAVSSSSVTLRTENGTQTVKTTSSTKYTKEQATISRAQIKVGDVVRVQTPRPSKPSTAPPTAPPTTTPGSGTVTATGIDVVLPVLVGRVSAVASGQYTLVGRSGQLLTISVNSSTRYYNAATKATSTAVKVGSRVVAEGAQDTLTHLSADTVTVLPTPAAGTAGRHGHGGWGNGPTR